MYLSVCPESLDQVAVSLAARVPELPTPAQVVGDLEAIGACLPAFVNHTPARRSERPRRRRGPAATDPRARPTVDRRL